MSEEPHQQPNQGESRVRVVAPKWMNEERAAKYRQWMGDLLADLPDDDEDAPPLDSGTPTPNSSGHAKKK